MTTLVVISAGLSQPSSTRLLADQLTQATREASGRQLRIVNIELRDLAHDITNNLLTGFPSPELQWAIDAVSNADGVVAVTPVFSGSFSGLFKSFFDILDRDALVGKPLLMAATGGSARHSMVLDFALRPLFAYLKADIVSTGVFAATADFGSDDAGRSLADRIDRAGRELAGRLSGSLTGEAVLRDDLEPTPVRRAEREPDPFDALVPFAELLAR